jgi:Peptidyl-tRNA hydrolase PTH2
VTDPLRMFLVLRRGAVATLERAAVLGGAAAIACVRAFEIDPEWRERPGKVCLRARNPAQWAAVLGEPHALAGDPDGESVAALPPRRRSERGSLLERLQAMSSDLGPAPTELGDGDGVAYVLNPELDMSSGKVVAQVAHAAVMAAEALPEWAAAGAPGRLVAPPRGFAELCARDDLAARVVDAGLTEVAPGTVTVLALAPRG